MVNAYYQCFLLGLAQDQLIVSKFVRIRSESPMLEGSIALTVVA